MINTMTSPQQPITPNEQTILDNLNLNPTIQHLTAFHGKDVERKMLTMLRLGKDPQEIPELCEKLYSHASSIPRYQFERPPEPIHVQIPDGMFKSKIVPT